MKKPTEKQRKATELILLGGKKQGQAMIEAGYSPYTAKTPQKLTESKYFQDLLIQIDDRTLLEQLLLFATDDNDKRASLQAIDMLFKLKNRYPVISLKIEAYQDELNKLKEVETDDKEEEIDDKLDKPEEQTEEQRGEG